MKPAFILPLIALFGICASFLLLGCASKHIKTKASETRSEDGKTAHLSTGKNTEAKRTTEDFIIGFNPLKDDPDNPSPHNPLIKKFGDIPQVRTYMRLERKYLSGTSLTIDEAIELHTVDLYLYPHPSTEARLKYLKKHKEELEASGQTAEFEWKYTGTTHVDYSRSDGYTIKTEVRPDGSKTIYDSRVEGGVIEVPPQAESPYTDDRRNEKP